jgi:hypothetical protein
MCADAGVIVILPYYYYVHSREQWERQRYLCTDYCISRLWFRAAFIFVRCGKRNQGYYFRPLSFSGAAPSTQSVSYLIHDTYPKVHSPVLHKTR